MLIGRTGNDGLVFFPFIIRVGPGAVEGKAYDRWHDDSRESRCNIPSYPSSAGILAIVMIVPFGKLTAAVLRQNQLCALQLFERHANP